MNDDPAVTELVTRAANGDKRAWDALVERYAPLVWSVCRRHRLSDADAGDVGQVVWLQLTDELDRIRDPGALAGWLAATTQRACGRLRRAASRSQVPGTAWDGEHLPGHQSGITEHELLLAERRATLFEAFGRLSPCCQRLIAMLTEDQPPPHAQIGAMLGIPVGSVAPRRAQCLDTLRRDPVITGPRPPPPHP